MLLFMKYLWIALSVFCFHQVSHAESELPPVTTVSSVNLEQYLGHWYEIAAMPQFFERKCVGNTTADYALENASESDQQLTVSNRCEKSDGSISTALGRAKVVNETTHAKLKVTFVHFLGWQYLLGGDYWILGLGENYSFAVVGSPGRNYAWILGRTPSLSPAELSQASQILIDQGFDTCKLIFTPQNGGATERTPLCKK